MMMLRMLAIIVRLPRYTFTFHFIEDEYIKLSDKLGWLPTSTKIRLVYENTPEGSPPRALMINYYLYEANAKAVSRVAASAVQAFLVEYIAEDARRKWLGGDLKLTDVSYRNVSKIARCAYHEHDDQHPMCVWAKQKHGEEEAQGAQWRVEGVRHDQ